MLTVIDSPRFNLPSRVVEDTNTCAFKHSSREGPVSATIIWLMDNTNRIQRALWAGFMGSAKRFPESPAVIVEGQTLSYKELWVIACRIAATIQANPEFTKVPLTAVFAYRSVTAFAAVLGALLAGNGYVPLNRTFPVERTQVMFKRSRLPLYRC